LLEGKFSDEVDRYTIFDCRFPYEYEGGHIKGARNMWTQEALMEHMFSKDPQYPKDGWREVFIFHCEFSSRRGPNM
jgi:rhodanese-related sulfurtransferase